MGFGGEGCKGKFLRLLAPWELVLEIGSPTAWSHDEMPFLGKPFGKKDGAVLRASAAPWNSGAAGLNNSGCLFSGPRAVGGKRDKGLRGAAAQTTGGHQVACVTEGPLKAEARAQTAVAPRS